MNSAQQNTRNDLLSVTAFFSALFHAVFILGVSFKLPDIGARSSTDNTLDVVLLNSSNNEKVDDSEIISSNDNAGGGSDDREAESPLPWKAVTPSPIQSVQKQTEQQLQTSIAPDQLITSKDGELTVQKLAPKKPRLENKEKTTGPDKFNVKARQLERERLLAKLSREQEEYNKRPRKVFLSPTTKAHGAAKYLDSWKQRVVAVGNANYPVQIKARGLQGTVILTVELNSNGTIASIKLNTPSQSKLLNDTAKRILRDASPFDAFPNEEFFDGVNILVITRAFHFLPGNRFSSSAAGS